MVSCLDVETVPDRGALPPGLGEGDFPPLPCHKIVAISTVNAEIVRSASDRSEWYRVSEVRSGGREDYCEADLLRAFWNWFRRCRPRLVTWNGRRFDLQVIMYRSMVHGLQGDRWFESGDKWENYEQRYAADWHCDLADVLSSFGGGRMASLDDLARVLGLPGKIGGHGSGVEEMVASGRLDMVRAYCEGDVLNLFGMYIRWALLTGRMAPQGHDASVSSLVDLLERERDSRPHLGVFLDAWRTSDRPAPMFISKPLALAPRPDASGGAALATGV
jgi:predicted PolB exonuclease-like 3'-5' exonuclease